MIMMTHQSPSIHPSIHLSIYSKALYYSRRNEMATKYRVLRQLFIIFA